MNSSPAPSDTPLLQLGREVLSRQPFSVLLGAQLDALEPGRAELSLPMVAALQQQHGFAHGGVLAYLADNALTFAGGSLLGDAVTLEFKINYLRPVTNAERLQAVASVAGSGRTQAVCRCEVFMLQGEDRALCAVAQGTIRKVG